MFNSKKIEELENKVDELKKQIISGYDKYVADTGNDNSNVSVYKFLIDSWVYKEETLVEKVERIDDTLTKLMKHLKLASEMTEEKKSEIKIIKTK